MFEKRLIRQNIWNTHGCRDFLQKSSAVHQHSTAAGHVPWRHGQAKHSLLPLSSSSYPPWDWLGWGVWSQTLQGCSHSWVCCFPSTYSAGKNWQHICWKSNCSFSLLTTWYAHFKLCNYLYCSFMWPTCKVTCWTKRGRITETLRPAYKFTYLPSHGTSVLLAGYHNKDHKSCKYEVKLCFVCSMICCVHMKSETN